MNTEASTRVNQWLFIRLFGCVKGWKNLKTSNMGTGEHLIQMRTHTSARLPHWYRGAGHNIWVCWGWTIWDECIPHCAGFGAVPVTAWETALSAPPHGTTPPTYLQPSSGDLTEYRWTKLLNCAVQKYIFLFKTNLIKPLAGQGEKVWIFLMVKISVRRVIRKEEWRTWKDTGQVVVEELVLRCWHGLQEVLPVSLKPWCCCCKLNTKKYCLVQKQDYYRPRDQPSRRKRREAHYESQDE